MRLLVRSGLNLRDVRVHVAVGEDEHKIGRSRTALVPGVEFDRTQIRYEVRLPDVAAGTNHRQVAGPVVMRILADAIFEEVGVLEDEAVVVEDLHHQRHRRDRAENRAVLAVTVVQAVLRVQRDREHAARLPLEAVRAAVGKLDLRAAAAFVDVHDLFVEMPDRLGRLPGRNIDQEEVAEVAASAQVHGSAVHA